MTLNDYHYDNSRTYLNNHTYKSRTTWRRYLSNWLLAEMDLSGGRTRELAEQIIEPRWVAIGNEEREYGSDREIN